MTANSNVADITDGRRLRGSRTREQALRAAVQLASVEGLEGLSIARLADRLGTGKSSVHGIFGSKEALQLAVLERTREILVQKVVRPCRGVSAGYQRLAALGESWMSYLEAETFEGGCILSSASYEMDGRPGVVRDDIAAALKEWLDLLATHARRAVEAGELDSATDPDQLAFELNAIGMSANWHYQLFDDPATFTRGRTAWAHLLRSRRAAN